MHDLYKVILQHLGVSLFIANQWDGLHPRMALREKTRALVEFDREITLAQRRHDMSACTANQPSGD